MAKIKNIELYSQINKELNKNVIKSDRKKIENILGVTIEKEKFNNILENLGFKIENENIFIPSYRNDIFSSNDIAEEVARVLGYDNLPSNDINLEKLSNKIPSKSVETFLRKTLTLEGFSEVINSPFVENQSSNCFTVDNPLDSNRNSMRTSLRESLINNLMSKKLSIIIPCYNEESNIPSLLDEIKESHVLLTEKYQLSEISSSLDKQVLGLFADEHLRDEDKKDNHDLEPSLAEMLQYSITRSDLLMNQGCEGFFIMAEGSQVDWAGHVNDFDYLIREMEDFDEAVDLALEIAKERQDTLVLVTSDHEVGGLLIEPANPIDNSLDDVKFSFITAVGSGTHTGVPVPVYAYGPGSENFTGTLDNTDIYYAMLAALDLDDKKGSCLGR